MVAETERLVPPESWPVWTLGNHDLSRYATRWAKGDPAKARLALMLLLTLRGTPVLYYGDELAMTDTHVPDDRLVDLQRLEHKPPRDPYRTPMPWSAGTGHGFTDDGAEPWLPFGDHREVNVATQRDNPGSPLHLTRDLIALRREREDLRSGAYERLDAPDGAWAYRRGARHAVALNLSDAAATLPGLGGTVLIGTDRARDGDAVADGLELGPWDGVVLEEGSPGERS